MCQDLDVSYVNENQKVTLGISQNIENQSYRRNKSGTRQQIVHFVLGRVCRNTNGTLIFGTPVRHVESVALLDLQTHVGELDVDVERRSRQQTSSASTSL